MSQLLEGPSQAQSGLQQKPLETSIVSDQQGFDIARVLWRWKWLPILGVIVGAMLGFLIFSQMYAQFQAIALIQVVETRPPMTGAMQAYNPADIIASINRTDESMVIRSKIVLERAVRNGSLTDLGQFKDVIFKEENDKVDYVVNYLLGSDNLTIQPADKDAKTTLVEIKYICSALGRDDEGKEAGAEEASRVVEAIVAAYTGYLDDEFSSSGDKIFELVKSAQDGLEKNFEELRKENNEFRSNVDNIVWNGSDPTDPYYSIYVGIHNQLSTLQLTKANINAVLTQVKEGREAGRDPEQFLVMLSENDAIRDLVDAGTPFLRTPMPQAPVEIQTGTQSKKMYVEMLFPKMMEKNRILDTFGDGHPSVVRLEKEIQDIQELINQTAENEKAEQRINEKLAADAHEKLASELLPGGLSVEQQLNIRLGALDERLRAIEKEETELKALAQENLEKSQSLQSFIDQYNLQQKKLQGVQALLDSVAEKVNAMDLLPPAGHKRLNVLNPAPKLGWYYGPTLPPYLFGGAAVGFIILSGIAVLMDLADRSYRSPDEIALDLGIPVLGHIPVIDTQKVKKVVEIVDPSVTTIHHSRGRASEAYRSVRTGLFFSNRGSELKVIQITSPVPGDGKSTLSSNLAVTMAQSGRRVLLIDADFRRPRIAKIFGIETNVGMAQVVAGRAELEDATYTSCVANLSIMPGGRRPSNPAELLSSNRFRELLDVLRDKYDIIIIDTPPLLAVSEPSAVAALVDGVVLTMRLRRNVKPLAMRAGRVLESVDAQLLGVVVNGVAGEAGYGYTYGYNDYRYAYRYGGNYRYGYKYGSKYGYGYGGKYGSYSAGYLEESPEGSELSETDKQDR